MPGAGKPFLDQKTYFDTTREDRAPRGAGFSAGRGDRRPELPRSRVPSGQPRPCVALESVPEEPLQLLRTLPPAGRHIVQKNNPPYACSIRRMYYFWVPTCDQVRMNPADYLPAMAQTAAAVPERYVSGSCSMQPRSHSSASAGSTGTRSTCPIP